MRTLRQKTCIANDLTSAHDKTMTNINVMYGLLYSGQLYHSCQLKGLCFENLQRTLRLNTEWGLYSHTHPKVLIEGKDL